MCIVCVAFGRVGIQVQDGIHLLFFLFDTLCPVFLHGVHFENARIVSVVCDYLF